MNWVPLGLRLTRVVVPACKVTQEDIGSSIAVTAGHVIGVRLEYDALTIVRNAGVAMHTLNLQNPHY